MDERQKKRDDRMNRRRVECQAIMMLWYAINWNGMRWFGMLWSINKYRLLTHDSTNSPLKNLFATSLLVHINGIAGSGPSIHKCCKNSVVLLTLQDEVILLTGKKMR